MRYPPGPTSLARTGYELYRDPLGLLKRVTREYGDIVHSQFGSRHDYIVNHPDYIKIVLLAGEDDMLRSFPRPMKRVLGNGLLSSQGDFHRRQRRLIQPFFHCQHAASCAQIITGYAQRTAEHWRNGQTLDISAEMLRLTMAIVVKALFSADVENEAAQIGRVLDVIMEMTHKNTIPYVDQFPARLPLPSKKRYENARVVLDEMVYRMIDERRAATGEQGDFLSALLHLQATEDGRGLSDEQVRDEVMTMFVAGHETIGSALAWTWYLLAEHPEAERRLQEELGRVLGGRVPTGEDVARLPYASMILFESMRLYPPVWLMARRPVHDFPIGDYIVPAGSYIHISQYLMHRDERYFAEPDRFDPDRWKPEAVASRPRFSYFPFGGGSRKCVGESFACVEGVLVLATLAQQWTMRVTPGQRVEMEPLITLRPKHGITVKLRQRDVPATTRAGCEAANA
jgi:cytochrome P450